MEAPKVPGVRPACSQPADRRGILMVDGRMVTRTTMSLVVAAVAAAAIAVGTGPSGPPPSLVARELRRRGAGPPRRVRRVVVPGSRYRLRPTMARGRRRSSHGRGPPGPALGTPERISPGSGPGTIARAVRGTPPGAVAHLRRAARERSGQRALTQAVGAAPARPRGAPGASTQLIVKAPSDVGRAVPDAARVRQDPSQDLDSALHQRVDECSIG
jgi:hypothetical protein